MKFIRFLNPRVFVILNVIAFPLEFLVVNPGHPGWALAGVAAANFGGLCAAGFRYWMVSR